NKWYYINSKIKHIAFYKPEIIEHKVYEIVFNSDNQAFELNIYDEEDLNKIEFNQDYTDTRGNKETLLQNILKGVGNSPLQ
ncbi:MAG: hypothetical protein HOF44_03420, partial [Pelagibacterales bacterium]|nr:hypothetical protein [Pelagibacterales bacterium]